MFDALKRWGRRRVLARSALPDALWDGAVASLPFVADLAPADRARLRDLVVLFLDRKSIVGAGGHDVTPSQRVVIAVQACVIVLELGLDWYDDFESVVVYPDEFVPGWTWEDEAGVVHAADGPLAGEAMPGGPVVLSWPDVEASADFEAAGMNLVIHEFAHKLDMRDGDANGCPPLASALEVRAWKTALTAAYDDFVARVDRDEVTAIDPYAAESPGEFFAVLSEVFFASPATLAGDYPDVYRQFATFYRQDPAARAGAPRRG
ncbi:MtfA peptidase [Burkholderiales bacterium]|nr:MtfA peptidase [Burkholderiales bacterium]